MRYGMGAVIALLVVALAVCAGLSRKSKRSMAPSVAKLIGALVMPVTGNLIIFARPMAVEDFMEFLDGSRVPA